ncbi:MAG: serine/threonine-protein kinase [Archangium sp.]|nr:serine/threonine-protein kinase [Archangium sp.]
MAKEPFEAVNANELIGKVLDGRYKVESVLGQGGMGMVFKGIQTSVQRPVALKTLHPQLAMAPTFFERFKREAEMASRLHHPNIITIYDFGKTAEGLCYYVMEMLEGESLRERIKRDGPFTLRQAAAIIEQAAAGVAHAHHTQVIHRDLKPHNIMLTSVDGNEYVKVLDFGLVKALEQEEEEQLTSTGQVLGTPQYMPPEQAGGEVVDQRSDLFSLTGVFYYCLTGHSPYGANSVRKALTLALAANVPAIETYRKGSPVPRAIDEFMVKGLKPEKEDRFQTAEDFVQSMHAALSGTPDSVLDAVPLFTPETGSKDSGSGSSSASRKSGASRSKVPSKAISAVSRPLPRQASKIEPAPAPEEKRQPPPPQGVPLGALVAVAAVLVLLIGGALVWKLAGKTEPVEAPPPLVANTPPEVPARVEATPAKVTLKTTPDGAEVLEGGVMIGNTPLTLDWARGTTRELTFKLAGHKDLVKTLRSEADQSFDFQLEPAPSSKPPPGKKPPPKKGPDIGAFD